MSLFPASKTIHTSMPIGRAVPVYNLDMNGGDHLKLDVSQVTRFLTLKQPVMQDYEVELAAFFVPYVAFDEFFKQKKVSEGIVAGNYPGLKPLNARTFFNPATDNVDRAHPASYKLKRVLGVNANPIGSIYDHLGYSIPSPLASEVVGKADCVDFDGSTVGADEIQNINRFVEFSAFPNILAIDANGGGELLFNDLCGGYVSTTEYGLRYPYYYCKDDYDDTPGQQVKIRTFFNWLQKVSPWKDVVDLGTMASDSLDQSGWNSIKSSTSNCFSNSQCMLLLDKFYGLSYQTIRNHIIDDQQDPSFLAQPCAWESIFGETTVSEVMEKYSDYVSNRLVVYYGGDTIANSIRYMAYMQIYGDWFINQQFTPRKDWLDWCGCAYAELAKTGSTTTWENAWTTSNSMYGSQSLTNQLSYFAPFVKNNECLPVLWAGDNFNSILKNDTLGGVGTATGSTIESHLYNRMYAKFKDVINRLTGDYRANSKSVYGYQNSDSTLYRSQVIGYRRFPVAIGDCQQTSASSETSALGQFSGYAVSRGNIGAFEWTADEPGIVQILAYIRPKNVCVVGQVDKSIFKDDYFDYLLPHFGGVGYQQIEERELNAMNGDSTLGIGWRERYYEYMLPVNECHGQMRTTMKYLNADRYHITTPNPNNDSMGNFLYMGDKYDIMRVFTDETATDPIAMQLYFGGDVTRKLPATIRTDF